jgi:enamine deaminase RidA (YjgF/YER057c/UK114 family)
MADRRTVVPQGVSSNPAFSPGVVVGDLLLVSGQVSQDAEGKPFGVGDAEAQTRRVFERIRGVVEAAGATMADVSKITTYLTDIAHYPSFSRVRGETFPTDPPASTTVVVAGLVLPEYLVEVEAIVRLP